METLPFPSSTSDPGGGRCAVLITEKPNSRRRHCLLAGHVVAWEAGTGSAVFRHRFGSIFFLLSLCPPRPQTVFLLSFDRSPLTSDEISISSQLARCCQGSRSSCYPSALQLMMNHLPATARTVPGPRYPTTRIRYFFHLAISTTKSSKLFSATSDLPELRGRPWIPCPGGPILEPQQSLGFPVQS